VYPEQWGMGRGAAHLVMGGTFLKMVLIFYGGYAHVVIASYAGKNHDQCR